MKILLGREEVDPNKSDGGGRTPLSRAARHWGGGFCAGKAVVGLLLGRRGVGSRQPDNDGRTPLSHTAEAGIRGMVGILLGREVNPNKPDNGGRTHLSCASWGRSSDQTREYIKVVKMLIGREEGIPDKSNNDDRTPLSYAAEHGFEGVAGMLLGRGEVNPNKPDNLGRTPLMLATSGGHEGVVTLLQSHEAVAVAPPNAEQSPPRRSYRHFFASLCCRSRKLS